MMMVGKYGLIGLAGIVMAAGLLLAVAGPDDRPSPWGYPFVVWMAVVCLVWGLVPLTPADDRHIRKSLKTVAVWVSVWSILPAAYFAFVLWRLGN